MTFTTAALLYLLLSRALITAAGIAGMWFGYRLFMQARSSETPAAKGSTIETSVLGARFKIQNAAPGVAFSLFGAILIIVMLIQSAPSVTVDTLQKAAAGSAPSQEVTPEKIAMRNGDMQDTISTLTAKGKDLESRGDTTGAEQAYKDAVTSVAEPINDLAWIYLQSGRTKDSLSLATVAVQLRPDEPRYVDTLEKSRAANNSPAKSIRH